MRTIIRVSQITISIYASLTLTLGWLLLIPVFGQTRDPIEPYFVTQAEPGSSDAPVGDPTETQSRGLPPQGVIVQGDQLKAAPGYTLEKGANNQMMARQKAGGGLTMSLNCGCVQGTGSCHPTVSGGFPLGGPSDVAVCAKSPNGPCSGQCGWTWAPTKVEPSRGR